MSMLWGQLTIRTYLGSLSLRWFEVNILVIWAIDLQHFIWVFHKWKERKKVHLKCHKTWRVSLNGEVGLLWWNLWRFDRHQIVDNVKSIQVLPELMAGKIAG